MDVITEENIIDDVLSRGVADILPDHQKVKQKLLEGKPLRIYLGLDATGEDLHLGHAKNIILLERFRRLGHNVVLLFGDFTAMIGDPTDKTAARTRLSQEKVERNMQAWRDQVSPILSLDDPDNPAVIRQNSEWLRELSFDKVVDIASHFTVQHVLERDMFETRMKQEKPVYLHEFLYPLMQGYDSVALDVDGEIGGTDQMFNMLAGRTLQQTYNNKEKFVLTTTLFEDPTSGKKLMSKSDGNYVSLRAQSADMYGGIMALPDEVIIPLFEGCTFLPTEEIRDLESNLSTENPRDIKMRLAAEITALFHGADEAQKAQENFVTAFQEGGLPSEVPERRVKKGETLIDALVENGVVESKTAFRRLVDEGAVQNYETRERVTDPTTTITESLVLKIGKRRFIRFTVSEEGSQDT